MAPSSKGPETRLPLILFVSFLAVLGLQIFTAEDKATEADKRKIEEARLADGVADEELTGGPGDGAGVTADSVDGASADGGSTEPDASVPDVEPWSEWIEFGEPRERGYMRVRFDSLGGSIAEIRLGNYFVRAGLTEEECADRDNWAHLVEPAVEFERTLQTLMVRPGLSAKRVLKAPIAKVHWDHELLDGGAGVRFTHEDASGLVLAKTIRWIPGQYNFDVTLGLERRPSFDASGLTTNSVALNLVAAVGVPAENSDSAYPEPRAVAARVGGDPDSVTVDPKGGGANRKDTIVAGDIAYVGSYNKYFGLFLRPADESASRALKAAKREYVFDAAWAYGKGETGKLKGFRDILAEGEIHLTVPDAGEATSRDFVLYAGPKDADAFGPGDEAYKDILQDDLGFFDGIAGLILGFLRFLHGIFGNWGWSIIVLTLVVRLMLFPLQRRMQTSMARHATKMRRVQPKIDAMKEKYAKDPQRLRQEQAKIFQEEGAMPPLGGCLPMFLQIPIFFGLFSALRVAFDLRHQPFMGWIKDLSQPDRLAEINFNTHLPFIEEIKYFNLLPILMVVLWVAQQKVMPKPAAMNDQARQMQTIMMWMPVMFGFFLYRYAAGLSLYMITTSIFGIIESTVIRKVWPIDETEQPKKKSKFMARMQEMQKQALAMQEAQARQRAGGGGTRGGAGGKGRGNNGGGKKGGARAKSRGGRG